MEFNRTGIVLYAINYQECLDFYRSVLELRVMFETEKLTCFEFGDSYLMVEIDDEYKSGFNTNERIRSCLRMNISDVRALSDKLINQNIEVDYQEHDWGTVAKFFDPDGNLCAFKDSKKFELQVLGQNKFNKK